MNMKSTTQYTVTYLQQPQNSQLSSSFFVSIKESDIDTDHNNNINFTYYYRSFEEPHFQRYHFILQTIRLLLYVFDYC